MAEQPATRSTSSPETAAAHFDSQIAPLPAAEREVLKAWIAAGGSIHWTSGFLPAQYQGVVIRSQGETMDGRHAAIR